MLKELNTEMGRREYDMYQDIPSKESGSNNECYGLPYENLKSFCKRK